MRYDEFAKTVKAKYPEYQAVDDRQLAEKIVEKYPEYKSVVEFDDATSEAPGMLKSAALGVMSGIPGAETVVSGIGAIGDKTYEESHKNLEDLKDQAWEGHPVAYGGGKTAGMVGTAVAAPVSIPAMATMGGLAGVDAATNFKDMPMAAAQGAGKGMILGKAGEMVGNNIISPLMNKVFPKVGKSLVANLGKDISPAQVEEYLARPGAINAASTPAELAGKVANLTNDVTKTSGHLSSDARAMLSPTKAPLGLPVESAANPMLGTAQTAAVGDDTIKPVFDNLMGRFTQSGVAPTAEKEAAVKVLQSEYDKLSRIAQAEGGQVSEQSLRKFIDSLQDTVNKKGWGDPSVVESQNALKQLSGELRGVLEKSNPAYGEAMAPSAKAAGLSSDLQKGFGIEEGAPTDATATKLGNVLKEGKPEMADLAQRLKDETGFDLMQALKDSDIKGAFTSGGSGASLKTLMASLGYGAGKMTGIPFGGIGGAAVGRYAAEGMNGAAVAKKVLDAYMNTSQRWSDSATRGLVQKYGPILANAAKVGGNQLAATHFVLATSDPAYQKMTDQLQNENK